MNKIKIVSLSISSIAAILGLFCFQTDARTYEGDLLRQHSPAMIERPQEGLVSPTAFEQPKWPAKKVAAKSNAKSKAKNKFVQKTRRAEIASLR